MIKHTHTRGRAHQLRREDSRSPPPQVGTTPATRRSQPARRCCQGRPGAGRRRFSEAIRRLPALLAIPRFRGAPARAGHTRAVRGIQGWAGEGI